MKQRKQLPTSGPWPNRSNNFLDNCMFGPSFPEDEKPAVEYLWELVERRQVYVQVPHSVIYEANHPKTPPCVKRAMAQLVRTRPTQVGHSEQRTRDAIRAIYVGNSQSSQHLSDAEHICLVSHYHGYFISCDRRFVQKRDQLQLLCNARLVTPTEWVALYERSVKEA